MRWLFILLALAFYSCKEISFREPQPKDKKSLTSVPEELQGSYLPREDNGEYSKDTIVIDATGYRFGYYNPEDRNNSNDTFEKRQLGDSLVLRFYKGYYFVSINDNPEWLLRVFRKEPNGDLIYMTPQIKDMDFKEYLKRISNEVKIDSAEVNGEMLYQADPSPKKLISLIEKGYFSKSYFKKIR